MAEHKASYQIAVEGGEALRCDKKLKLQWLYLIKVERRENDLILGEEQTDSKYNGITVIPLLIESLDIKEIR